MSTESSLTSKKSNLEKWTTYTVLDNGMEPFRVKYNKEIVKVFENTIETETKNDPLIIKKKYQKVFVGKDPEANGNSMLFLLNNGKYLYVGYRVFVFETSDEIIDYKSPIGKNCVPYPYAIGEKYTYLMLEQVYAKNKELNKGKKKIDYYHMDPYMSYYGFNKNDIVAQKFKKLRGTFLAERRLC